MSDSASFTHYNIRRQRWSQARWYSQVFFTIMLTLPLICQANTKLPQLVNTQQGDRSLLREISDDHVYQQQPLKATHRSNRAKPANRAAHDAWQSVLLSRRLDIPDKKKIRAYRQQYQREALWISRILARASPFIGYIVDELDARVLPLELALLPVIESGYQPDVHSSQQAAGLWQLIPGTAAEANILTTIWFDGRSDIRESTQAALDYLAHLNATFNGDWALTLAAYNAGLGRVRNAIRQNEKSGLPGDFWSLKLPTETRHYVPKFLALLAMLRYDKPPGLVVPSITRGSAFDLVDAAQRVNLRRLAKVISMDESGLSTLNAGLVQGVTPPAGPHKVYVPQGTGSSLVKLLQQDNPPTLHASPDTHLVAAGDTISSIAQQHGISQKLLKRINNLETDLIRIGQILTVLEPQYDTPQIEYVVTIGDTLTDIARRFDVSVQEIRDENGQVLSSDIIHPGERLTLSVMLPSKH